MKIVFHIGEPIICGGILVPCQQIGELRKRGIDAWGIATRQDAELEKYMGIPFKNEESLKELTDDDVIVAVRWEFCGMLENYKGKKFQLVQGRDLDADCGEDWKEKLKQARNNPKWELIGVSKFCLKDWDRGTVIPNGISERFFIENNTERPIDILIEGNNEPNKNIDEAVQLARPLDSKVAWLGRETCRKEGVDTYFTNPKQEAIPEIYQKSKIMIKLSKSEGFSLPILEAMACGCAVITRPMGGNDFCVYGWNCERPENIEKVLANKEYREILVRNGLETAKEFTWKKSVDLLLSLIQK